MFAGSRQAKPMVLPSAHSRSGLGPWKADESQRAPWQAYLGSCPADLC